MSETTGAEMKEVEQANENQKFGNLGSWVFDGGDGKEYPLYPVNGTGSVTIPIERNDQIKGYISALFKWNPRDIEPFYERLDSDLTDETDANDDWTERKRSDYVRKNARFFREVIHSGHLIRVNEFGEQSEPIEKNRDAMLSYPPEIQSDLVSKWLNNFHIERFFPKEADELEALLGNTESIYFAAKVGNIQKPAHVILFECAVPSADARASYRERVWSMRSKDEGGKSIKKWEFDQQVKYNFAKKHLRNVSGCGLGRDEDVFIEQPLSRIVFGEKDSEKAFKTLFNPQWLIDLGDNLAASFFVSGK